MMPSSTTTAPACSIGFTVLSAALLIYLSTLWDFGLPDYIQSHPATGNLAATFGKNCHLSEMDQAGIRVKRLPIALARQPRALCVRRGYSKLKTPFMALKTRTKFSFRRP